MKEEAKETTTALDLGTELDQLEAMRAQLPDSEWICHDKRIDDATLKWVIYQAGFDAGTDIRLEYICRAINLLPHLIGIAREWAKGGPSLVPCNSELPTMAAVSKMIQDAIAEHEQRKHPGK